MNITLNINVTSPQPVFDEQTFQFLDELLSDFDDSDDMVETINYSPPSPPSGVYMTLEDFAWGKEAGVYGPDEDVRWVYINSFGQLAEEAYDPKRKRPDTTIAAVYYAA